MLDTKYMPVGQAIVLCRLSSARPKRQATQTDRLSHLSLVGLAILTSGILAAQPALIESGQALFQSNCAFCHGRDAEGGETGPDLTRSKLVGDDKSGSTITPVVREGRNDKGMPSFNFSAAEMSGLAAFIHAQ